MPVKFRVHGLKNGLIGKLKLPGTHDFERDLERLNYVDKQLKGKHFVPFYAPHQRQGQYEFSKLFEGIVNNPEKIPLVLLNITDNSVYSMSIPKE